METVIKDVKALLDVSTQLFDEGLSARFRASGTSMRPTIQDGDAITVSRVAPADIRRGDIVLYRSRTGAIVHRVVDIEIHDSIIAAFVLRGDAKKACDAPVAPEQIVARVVSIDSRPPDDGCGWRARVAAWVRAGLSPLR